MLICIKDSLPLSYSPGSSHRYNHDTNKRYVIHRGSIILDSRIIPGKGMTDELCIKIENSSHLSYFYLFEDFQKIEEFRNNRIEEILSYI
jgi:hypothetical protein